MHPEKVVYISGLTRMQVTFDIQCLTEFELLGNISQAVHRVPPARSLCPSCRTTWFGNAIYHFILQLYIKETLIRVMRIDKGHGGGCKMMQLLPKCPILDCRRRGSIRVVAWRGRTGAADLPYHYTPLMAPASRQCLKPLPSWDSWGSVPTPVRN